LSSRGSGKAVAGCDEEEGEGTDEDEGGVEGVEEGADELFEPVRLL